MANYWAEEDFALVKSQRQKMKAMAAEYPQNPTAEQDAEFVNNVCAEFGWKKAAGQYFGLLGAPERAPVAEDA